MRRRLQERVRLGMASKRGRVAVVGADALRSLGLISILEDGQAGQDIDGSAVDLSALSVSHDFDAVLLDVRFPEEQMMAAVARLRRKRGDLKIIVMGESMDMDRMQAFIGAGARGYLSRDAGEGEIRMAVKVVLDGSIWAPRKVLARLIDAGAFRDPGTSASMQPIEGTLSPRELEVLTLLTNGRSNREIAVSMGIEQATVKAHLGRMLRKTGTHNRIELSLRAMGVGAAEHG